VDAIPRLTLTERVAEAILDQILRERLGEGDALPSTGELAKRLDVSVVVVREALATLAGRGIVSRRQGRESVVARPGPEVLDSVFRVRTQQDSITADEFQQCRAALELQSASLAADAASAEQRAAALEPLIEAMRAERELEALTELDRRFHLAIADLSENRAIWLLLSSVNSVLRDSIHRNWENLLRKRNSRELDRALDLHAAIAEAILAGDRRRAIAAMSAHFSYWGPDFGLGDVAEADGKAAPRRRARAVSR
jgi:GntR family transcriptional repressor for pyruvate dehydrogenase complex